MHYCEKGHWLGEDYNYPYCPTCGAKAISKCPSCGADIPSIPNMLVRHCVMCGKPFFRSDTEVRISTEMLKKVLEFVQSDAFKSDKASASW